LFNLELFELLANAALALTNSPQTGSSPRCRFQTRLTFDLKLLRFMKIPSRTWVLELLLKNLLLPLQFGKHCQNLFSCIHLPWSALRIPDLPRPL